MGLLLKIEASSWLSEVKLAPRVLLLVVKLFTTAAATAEPIIDLPADRLDRGVEFSAEFSEIGGDEEEELAGAEEPAE